MLSIYKGNKNENEINKIWAYTKIVWVGLSETHETEKYKTWIKTKWNGENLDEYKRI